MAKSGQIIKISKGTMTEIANKDISYYAKNINTSAGININENAKDGVHFGKNKPAPKFEKITAESSTSATNTNTSTRISDTNQNTAGLKANPIETENVSIVSDADLITTKDSESNDDRKIPRGIILDKKLTKDQVSEILGYLQKLTDDRLTFKPENYNVVITNRNNSGKKPSGTGLIRALVDHQKHVTITPSMAGFWAGESGSGDEPLSSNATNGAGSNAEIGYGNIDRKFLTENINTGNLSLETQPRFITLGHELIHANTIMDGNASNKIGRYFFKDLKGKTQWEKYAIDEFRTVGLSGWSWLKGNYTTENKLRKEHGIGKRVAYGTGWTEKQKQRYGYYNQ